MAGVQALAITLWFGRFRCNVEGKVRFLNVLVLALVAKGARPDLPNYLHANSTRSAGLLLYMR